MSNRLPLELVARLRTARDNGASIRALARKFGISSNTVKRYIQNDDGAMCGCGCPAGHQGWCKVRYAKSAARQAFHATRRGVFLSIEVPRPVSRVTESTTEKRKWVGALDISAPSIDIREHYKAIGEVMAATGRVPRDVQDDVRQEMIVACLSGRLPIADITRAVVTFIGFIYRGNCYEGADPRFNKPDNNMIDPGRGLLT